MKQQHLGGNAADHRRVTAVIWRKIRVNEVEGNKTLSNLPMVPHSLLVPSLSFYCLVYIMPL